jgi:hypothetical protein
VNVISVTRQNRERRRALGFGVALDEAAQQDWATRAVALFMRGIAAPSD